MPVQTQSLNKPLPILRSTTTLAASATSNLIPSWPCDGYGTCRIFVESNVSGTLNFRQSQKNGVKRTTNSQAIAAATGTSAEFLIAGEELAIQYINDGTIQARFVLVATLQP